MVGRTIAIGDIHGCSIALAALIADIDPQPHDAIVTLGDYVDRGIDSKGVLDQLIELSARCHLVSILGNHDQMMLRARKGPSEFRFWMQIGGDAALDSYSSTGTLDRIPVEHFSFLEHCVSDYVTDTHFFVHANYKPDIPIDQLDDQTLRWLSLRDSVPGPHCSGKIAVLGHTPQEEVLDLGYLICLDTGCCSGGWLTAMDVVSGQIWQYSEHGSPRH
jgi:serine/threonine protein phosphatase 1